MIDFRYHLVSLVSVFLALAVGVVLGAGPLQGAIEQRVVTLAAEKDTLRSELTAANDAVREREQFTQQILPAAVAGRLNGTTVSLVLLPKASGALADDVTSAVEAAGGTVTSRVQLTTDWLAEESLERRQTLVAELAAITPAPQPSSVASASNTPSAAASGPTKSASASRTRSASPARSATSTGSPAAGASPNGSGSASATGSPVAASSQAAAKDAVAPLPALNEALARSLIAPPGAAIAVQTPADATAARRLAAMADAGLISVSTGAGRLAQTVVVVAPPVPQAEAGAAPPDELPLLKVQAPAWAALGATLDGAGDGGVVIGPSTAAENAGVLAAVRGTTSFAQRVSTVDTGDSAMGPLTTALALEQQRRGEVGAYGFGSGASAPVPPLVPGG